MLQIPSATLNYMKDGEVKEITTEELTAGKKVWAVPCLVPLTGLPGYRVICAHEDALLHYTAQICGSLAHVSAQVPPITSAGVTRDCCALKHTWYSTLKAHRCDNRRR